MLSDTFSNTNLYPSPIILGLTPISSRRLKFCKAPGQTLRVRVILA